MVVRAWQKRWDERIARWLGSQLPPDQRIDLLGARAIHDVYQQRNAPTSIQYEFLPEPYGGSPTSDELDAVWLTCNPGGGIDAQKPSPPASADGTVVAACRKASWSTAAANWGALAAGTRSWWIDKAEFAGAVVGSTPSLARIVGIDLLPWHSAGFGGIRPGRGAQPWKKYARDEVLMPAAHIAPATRLASVDPDERPIVFALTNQLEWIYGRPLVGLAKGLELSIKNAASKGVAWPRSDPNGDRRITVLEPTDRKSLDLRIIVFIAQRPADALSAPPSDFAPIVRSIVQRTIT